MEPTTTTQRMIEWALDLDHIRLGRDAPLSLHWERTFPLWIMASAGLLSVMVIAFLYRRERGSRAGRVVPAVCRIGLIGLVGVMLGQPVLRLQRNRIEPSHVALLIDRSRSMTQKDHYTDPDRARHVAEGTGVEEGGPLTELTRFELLKRALLRDDAAAIRAMLARNRLRVYSFGRSISHEAVIEGPVAPGTLSEPRPSGSDPSLPPSLASLLDSFVCDASSTNIPQALMGVLRRTEAGRLSAIVLASDGRTTEPTRVGDAIAAARAQQVPIYTVPLGSPTPRRDLFVASVAAQDNVFLKDLAAFRVTVGGTGLTAGIQVTVRLIDEHHNTQVAAETVELAAPFDHQEIELRVQPDRAGRTTYRIEVQPLEDELNRANNVVRVDVNILEQQLRVLYVEGYPRYQYRYLKNTLLREPTIRSSCLLLSADPDFVQEGTDPIRRFPASREELQNFDVVLFGDVDPTGEWLSPAQADLLVEHVVEHGGGFGVIAGVRNSPQTFAGTVLEKLLPVRIDANFVAEPDSVTALYHPRLTIEGHHSPLFRFDADPDRSDALFNGLAGLYWIARTLGPRPGAEVLAEHPRLEATTGPMPVLVVGRVGAGRVFFCAADDTWRWRHESGEWVFDAFWLHVLRELARTQDIGADRRVVIRTPRRNSRYGERVDVRVDVVDTELLPSVGRELHVLIRDSAGTPVTRTTVSRLGDSSNRFEGSFVPAEPGSFTLEVEELQPRPGRRRATTTIQVAEADLERRRPEADHQTLARIAEQTGGELVELDELPVKLAAIGDRSLRIPDDFAEPLWDSKLVLILFILMILTEWVMRKANGML